MWFSLKLYFYGLIGLCSCLDFLKNLIFRFTKFFENIKYLTSCKKSTLLGEFLKFVCIYTKLSIIFVFLNISYIYYILLLLLIDSKLQCLFNCSNLQSRNGLQNIIVISSMFCLKKSIIWQLLK